MHAGCGVAHYKTAEMTSFEQATPLHILLAFSVFMVFAAFF